MAQRGLKGGAGLVLALVAACATPAPAPKPGPPAAAAPPAPAAAPPPAAPAPPAPAPAPAPSADACGASTLQYLVGKPHTDIPAPVYPSRRRVVCSTCVMTQDHQSDRQTILFSAQTGLVTSVTCG
jgi:hypothetical protein